MNRSFLLLLTVCFCYAAMAVADTTKKEWRILYIGNSLTYTNDLPSLVEEMGRYDGRVIQSKSLTLPDHSLEDHWNEGKAEEEIGSGRYDFVIMQQGPSALPESQQLLLTYAKKFAAVCKKSGARMVLFEVWPSKARAFDFDSIHMSYYRAAEETRSLLCQVGLAWRNLWQMNRAVPLYGPDGFHPGPDGSLLAAMIIYAKLSGNKDLSFLDYEECSWKNKISRDLDRLLKTVTSTQRGNLYFE